MPKIDKKEKWRKYDWELLKEAKPFRIWDTSKIKKIQVAVNKRNEVFAETYRKLMKLVNDPSLSPTLSDDERKEVKFYLFSKYLGATQKL